LPVVTITGLEDGPTLYIQAGMHGDESTGIDVCRRFLNEIKPDELSGRIVAVPVANLPSHMTRTRGFLNEERWMIDMNRVWPGSEHGIMTERIAYALFNQFVRRADLTIDLHTALDGCSIMPFVYVWPNDDQAGTLQARVEAARAFGTQVYFHKRASKFGTSDVSRSLNMQADAVGAKVLLAEMGESRRVSKEFVQIGVKGIFNVLKSMKMLPGSPEIAAVREFDHFTIAHTNRGGGLTMFVDLGDEVTAGQPIGEVVDVFGQTIETINAPATGFVLRVMRLGSVGTGAEVAWIA
jgi:predicted deacylase